METGDFEGVARRKVQWVWLLLALGLFLVAYSILAPLFVSARIAGARSQLVGNLRALGGAWHVYASDYDDVGCTTKNWNELLVTHPKSGLTESRLVDPTIECRADADCMDNRALGLNRNLGGCKVAVEVDTARLVLFGQSTRSGPNLLISKSDMKEGFVGLAFFDASVRLRNWKSRDDWLWHVPAHEPANVGR